MLREKIDMERTNSRGKNQSIYDVLTMVKSGIEKEEKKNGKALDENAIELVIRREIKQLNETKESVKKFNKLDVIQECDTKIKYLETLVPKLMDENDIKSILSEVILKLNLKEINLSDKGKIMKEIMPQVKGKADGKLVTKVVEEYIKGNQHE